MHKHALCLIAALSFLPAAETREVSCEGVSIAVPEGEWKTGMGTCTGDSAWQREGIGFSIGTRRYLKRDTEWRSSGDIYTIYRFDDLKPEVMATMEHWRGRLVKEEVRKTKAGTNVMVLEFDCEGSDGSPVRTQVLYAFREAPDHRSAIEVRCGFNEKHEALGRKIFNDSLRSLCEESTHNQSVDSTASAGTSAAEQPRVPASAASHL